MSESVYTYQGGRKLELTRSETRFVSRATKKLLLEHDFNPLHDISPHSWCVVTQPDRLHEDLVRARRLAPAYPAYAVAASGAPFRVTDRIFVRFRRETSDADARQFAARFGLVFRERLSARDFLFAVPAPADVVDVVRNLTESGTADVEVIDHDLNIRPHLQEMPATEPDAAQQWQLLSSIDHPLIRPCALLDCVGAWDLNGYGDPDVVISLVDSGCDLSDPNFKPGKFVDWVVMQDGRLQSREDFSGPAAEELMDPPRVHGTLCATLAAASVNSFGGIGVAPECSLLPVKWQEQDGMVTISESLFAKLIDHLRNRVDVVSNSWNRGPNGYWTPHLVDRLTDAALYGGRHGNGIVWIWAAGNHNMPIHRSGDIQVPTATENKGSKIEVLASSNVFVNSFVGVPGVVHVGAISSRGQRCHYSNYGTGLDLVAPSGNYHLYGRGAADGLDVLAPVACQGLRTFRGTSAAAPQVAGVAALVRSANPGLTSCEIISLLRQTADRNLDMSGYPRSHRFTDPTRWWDVSPIAPFDSGDFVSAGHPDGPWSPWFGFGKINARRAVEEALRIRN